MYIPDGETAYAIYEIPPACNVTLPDESLIELIEDSSFESLSPSAKKSQEINNAENISMATAQNLRIEKTAVLVRRCLLKF
jgi:hypothetical protein